MIIVSPDSKIQHSGIFSSIIDGISNVGWTDVTSGIISKSKSIVSVAVPYDADIEYVPSTFQSVLGNTIAVYEPNSSTSACSIPTKFDSGSLISRFTRSPITGLAAPVMNIASSF